MNRVYVESSYYDGPRSGLADFAGQPHRFFSNFDETEGHLDTFTLQPISSRELELEIEQWQIFVDWNRRYELGEATTESHPGHGGIDKRWDELERILEPLRKAPQVDTKLARAEFESIEQEARYGASGPNYGVIWDLLEQPRAEQGEDAKASPRIS